jgi:uncharacterized damage-inducible protein DinB
MIQRPDTQEYNAFYGDYIELVPQVHVKDLLLQQLGETRKRLDDLPKDKQTYRYAAGKWSVAEVLGHITDTERVMCYRLLRIVRGDRTPLAGFDQDAFVHAAAFDTVPFEQLVNEYEAVRRSTHTMLNGLSEESLSQCGVANDKPVSARALVYIIAGHERHHLNVFRERYGV